MCVSTSPGSKNLEKGVQNGLELKHGSKAPQRFWSANRHFPSVDWHKCGPLP